MPCFRGLDISIGTNSGPVRLPEFPHPDSCSVTLLNPEPSASALEPADNSKLPFPKGTNIFRMKRAEPRTSVYVPSLPDTRFWVQYSILRLPSTGSHLYFKMFVNGNNVTNWGIDLQKRTTGAVTRALCKPDSESCRGNEAGQPTDSIKVRSFCFPPDRGFTAGARDEDLIEIQVFRASGRRRKVPGVHSYQEGSDERCLLGDSCLEVPEKAGFFDWRLLDRKDSPYATFRFYYQSWETLSKLGLLSQSTGTGLTEWEGASAGSTLTRDPSDTSVASFAQDPKWGTRCEHGDTCASCGIGVDSRSDASQTLAASHVVTRPPELLESSPGSARKPQPSKQMRDGFLDRTYHNRPLPALPIQRRRAAVTPDRPEQTSISSSVGEVRESNAAYTKQTMEVESNVQKGKQTHSSSSPSNPTRFKHSALALEQPSAAAAVVSSSAAQGRDYTTPKNRKQKAVRGLFSSGQKQGESMTAPAGNAAGRGQPDYHSCLEWKVLELSKVRLEKELSKGREQGKCI